MARIRAKRVRIQHVEGLYEKHTFVPRNDYFFSALIIYHTLSVGIGHNPRSAKLCSATTAIKEINTEWKSKKWNRHPASFFFIRWGIWLGWETRK